MIAGALLGIAYRDIRQAEKSAASALHGGLGELDWRESGRQVQLGLRESAKEPDMDCPEDGAVLQETDSHGVKIHECPQCQGGGSTATS